MKKENMTSSEILTMIIYLKLFSDILYNKRKRRKKREFPYLNRRKKGVIYINRQNIYHNNRTNASRNGKFIV